MKSVQYKTTGKHNLFDKETTAEKLSRLGNPLEKISEVIDFEMFRDKLEDIILTKGRDYSKGGAHPYDVVLMFKILVIKQLYNLSDDSMEYQLNDRLSFRNFVGLSSGDKVPDAKTIWSFGDKLSKAHAAEDLFGEFRYYLASHGVYVNSGQMVDATFVEIPKQQNTPEENKKIKSGEGDDLWKDNPHKKSQKDTDARWAKKGGKSYYGYKDHTKVDRGSKPIKSYTVTNASVHDSRAVADLVDEEDAGQDFFADSAYIGSNVAEVLEKNGMTAQIAEYALWGRQLTEEQIKSNKRKTRVRARVEHVYAFMEMSMNRMFCRSVGFVRNAFFIGMRNLVYNFCRYSQLVRYARS